MRTFLGLGSNLGNRRSYLKSACIELELERVLILNSSPIYESPAKHMKNQPDFLNQVIEVETILGPLALLNVVKTIEMKLGRKQGSLRYTPREIDIDVLAMDRFIFKSDKLNIPHSSLANRNFVLKPWSDVAPDFIVPVHDISVMSLLSECPDQSELIRIEELEYTV